jgi:GNAT superfamily N-acetyltransferase
VADGITIRRFRASDTKAVVQMISETFTRFNAPDATPEGARWFLESLKNTHNIRTRFLQSPICYVACRGSRIVGMVRGRTTTGLNTLFVDGRYHGKGIGRRLVERFERDAAKTGTKVIKLGATMHAVPFYTRMGFKKTTGVRNHHGIKVQPMKKALAKKP